MSVREVLRVGRRKTLLTVAAGSVAGLTAVGAAAWACTPPSGGSSTSVSPSSGPPGTRVTASGSGGTPSKPYLLKFIDSAGLGSGNECHHGTKIGGATRATGIGSIPATSGTIPTNASGGAGQVCFAQKRDAMRFTAPTTFTVT